MAARLDGIFGLTDSDALQRLGRSLSDAEQEHQNFKDSARVVFISSLIVQRQIKARSGALSGVGLHGVALLNVDWRSVSVRGVNLSEAFVAGTRARDANQKIATPL
jgi:hypothetical protein